MATDQQWAAYTGCTHNGQASGNATHAMAVRATPLEAQAILDLVLENLGYSGDTYYLPLWEPVMMRVAEFYESIGTEQPA